MTVLYQVVEKPTIVELIEEYLVVLGVDSFLHLFFFLVLVCGLALEGFNLIRLQVLETTHSIFQVLLPFLVQLNTSSHW